MSCWNLQRGPTEVYRYGDGVAGKPGGGSPLFEISCNTRSCGEGTASNGE